MTQPRYALHPGFVRSAGDGQEHYVGVHDLARLYRLRQGEYVRWDDQDPSSYLGRDPRAFAHLWPDSSGRYELIAERIEQERVALAGYGPA